MATKALTIHRERARIKVDRRLAKDEKHGYYEFFKMAWHVVEKKPLTLNFHIQYLCDRLQREVERIAAGKPKDKDLIICVPPRSSKSSIVTVFLNPWIWTKYPHFKIITTSFSSTLSGKHAIKSKLIIESAWYQKRWGSAFRLSRKKNTNNEFWNTEQGMRFASSVGGTVTGDGGHIIIGDDLIDPRQSTSKKMRENATTFVRETLSNRLDDADIGIIILMQQRTHAADVVGMEILENGDMYEQIILPAQDIAPIKPAGLARFYQDGLLDPVRFSTKILEMHRRRMSTFDAQYNQTPKKPGGNIWKESWFFEFTMAELYQAAAAAKHSLVWNFVLDGAYTKNKKNAPTVCLCYTVFRNRAYIVNILRDWMEYTECLDRVALFVKQNGYTSDSLVHIEPKANGLSLINSLTEIKGINAIPSYIPVTDKEANAHDCTPTLKAGRVGILKGAHWRKTYIDEVTEFPNSDYADQVDTTVMVVKNGLEGSDILASG